MNYYLWINGQEQGPYTLVQIQAAVDDGSISSRQTARTEESSEWKPIDEIASLKPAKKPKPQQPIQRQTTSAAEPMLSAVQTTNTNPSLKLSKPPESTLANLFKALAVFDFIAAFISIFVHFKVYNSIESNLWLFLSISAIGGGLILLAFAKVIECLHETVFRLRNLEEIACHFQSK